MLLVCTLKERLSGVRFSGVRYSRRPMTLRAFATCYPLLSLSTIHVVRLRLPGKATAPKIRA